MVVAVDVSPQRLTLPEAIGGDDQAVLAMESALARQARSIASLSTLLLMLVCAPRNGALSVDDYSANRDGEILRNRFS